VQANARRRRKHIRSLKQGDQIVYNEEQKATLAYEFFDEVLGTTPTRSNAINLDMLGLGTIDSFGLTDRFTEADVWATICALPPDKARGPDCFMTRFLQSVWLII
jgi:hypothetical protein